MFSINRLKNNRTLDQIAVIINYGILTEKLLFINKKGNRNMAKRNTNFEFIAINGISYRTIFTISGWEQTKKRCPACHTLLERTNLRLIEKIINLKTNHPIEPASEEGKGVVKKLKEILKNRCLECRAKSTRKLAINRSTKSMVTNYR